MSEENPLKIISVTGAHSQVGKTTLASILLNNLNDFGAIKFTKTSLYISVTDEPDIILEKNKDTAILSKAGAEKVVWIQSPASGLKDALYAALGKMDGLNGVVIEGNSPSDYLNPLVRIFIIGEDGEIKPSARMLSKKADIIIINTKNNLAALPISAELLHDKVNVFLIDLFSKTGDIEKLIACVKNTLGDYSSNTKARDI